MLDTNGLVQEMVSQYFGEATAMDKDVKCVPDAIEPIVKMLENKKYRVKYASPGHANTTFKNDKKGDHVINGKFHSTARVIFNHDYHFDGTPEGWEWKVLSNGSRALYVKPYTYNKDKGTPSEEFEKWRNSYLASLKSWVKDLPMMGNYEKDDDEEGPDNNFSAS